MSAHPIPRGPEDTAQLAHAVLAKLNAFKADTPNLGEVRGLSGEVEGGPSQGQGQWLHPPAHPLHPRAL